MSDPEEKRLRAAIERRFAEFLPHLLLSIHTGMRMSEQYCMRWDQVDFDRRQLHLIRTKNGDSRTIPLNAFAREMLGKGRGDGSRLCPKRPRFRNIPGIATAILLPVDS